MDNELGNAVQMISVTLNGVQMAEEPQRSLRLQCNVLCCF